MVNPLVSSPWLVCYKPNPQADLRLFCFPHAGAGPPFFRDWHKHLPDLVEVWVVQLPGRGSRLRESCFTQMSQLTEAATEVITAYIDKPFAFFGYSLGGWIGFEIVRQLRRQAATMPVHLFIASCRAPHLPATTSPSYQLSDGAFIELLRQGNGTPEEILQNEKLMRLFLPILKADAELSETYQYAPEAPLDCPISAFGGELDQVVSKDKIIPWREHTHRSFSLEMFPGDHFFLNHHHQAFLKTLSKVMDSDLNPMLATEQA